MSGGAPGGRSGGQSGRVELVQRITVLLGEIEALGQQTADVPALLLIEMRAILEKARRVLEACTQRPTRDADSEDDPQPDVDREILERMYRALGAGRASRQ